MYSQMWVLPLNQSRGPFQWKSFSLAKWESSFLGANFRPYPQGNDSSSSRLQTEQANGSVTQMATASSSAEPAQVQNVPSLQCGLLLHGAGLYPQLNHSWGVFGSVHSADISAQTAHSARGQLLNTLHPEEHDSKTPWISSACSYLLYLECRLKVSTSQKKDLLRKWNKD